MYTIECDGRLLYDPRVRELEVTNASLNLEVNKSGALKFTMSPNHPRYNDVKKMKSVVTVYQDNVLIFRGRPLNDVDNFLNFRTVTCEGELAYLNDTVQRPYDYKGSIRDFLELIIKRHNDMIKDSTRTIVLGEVTVTDPNDFIVRSDTSYIKTWKVLTEKCIKLLGGYFVIRRSGGVNYLDYLADSKYKSDQSITLGENLLDLSKSKKGQNIVTALIPLGATYKPEGSEVDITVDISSVNDGIDYVFHKEAVEQYGWIFEQVTWDNVTDPINLKRKAEIHLGSLVTLDLSFEIKAIDRNMYSGDFDRFRLFDYVKVESPVHSINDYYLIKKLSIDLINPINNTILVGADSSTLTDRQNSNVSAIETVREETKEVSKNVTEDIRQLTLTIEQTAEKYAREVKESITSDVNGWRTEISTEFQQMKDEFLFQFTSIIENIENIDGETRKQFEEIVKYIRFVDGNIILGQVDNDMILKISNDRISFIQDNTEVAYIEHNKLYIYDGEFINSLKLGSFAFIPRTNGNLSFKKVVN